MQSESGIEQAEHEVVLEKILLASPEKWIEWLARFGYASKGFVYIIIGVLALRVALGVGGENIGPTGALATLAEQRAGQVLLALVAVGLAGYAIWRLVRAWKDPEREGRDLNAILKRLGYAVSGTIYASFAYEAIDLILTPSGDDSEEQAEEWAQRMMLEPIGVWLLIILGVIIIGTGFYQFYRSYTARFHIDTKCRAMSEREKMWASHAGRLGFAARGVIYTLVGGFVILAARRLNPNEVRGVGEALDVVTQQAYGGYLLGALAVGLIAYGMFCMALAWYRRICVPAEE